MTYRTRGNDIVGPVGGQLVESVLLLPTVISFLRIQSQLLVRLRLGILQLHGLEIWGITPIFILIFILLPYVVSICVWRLGKFKDLVPFHSCNVCHHLVLDIFILHPSKMGLLSFSPISSTTAISTIPTVSPSIFLRTVPCKAPISAIITLSGFLLHAIDVMVVVDDDASGVDCKVKEIDIPKSFLLDEEFLLLRAICDGQKSFPDTLTETYKVSPRVGEKVDVKHGYRRSVFRCRQ